MDDHFIEVADLAGLVILVVFNCHLSFNTCFVALRLVSLIYTKTGETFLKHVFPTLIDESVYTLLHLHIFHYQRDVSSYAKDNS